MIKYISVILLVIITILAFNIYFEGTQEISLNQITLNEINTSGELKKFESTAELNEFIAQENNYGGFYARNTMVASMEVEEFAVMDQAVKSTSSEGVMGSDGYANDFSQTNVQYKEVDEADIVKNDGRYIYLVNQGTVQLIDSTVDEIVSELEFNEEFSYWRNLELFVKDDQLIVIEQTNERGFRFNMYDIYPYENYLPITKVHYIDISNKEKPEIESTTKLSGNYQTSRLIEDELYVLTNQDTYNARPFLETANTRILPDVYYFINPENNYRYTTITSFSENEIKDTKSFLLGYSNTVMVSPNNIYITFKQNNYDFSNKNRFYEIILPNLPAELKSEVNNVLDDSLSDEEQWELVSKEFEDFFNSRLDDRDNFDQLYKEDFENLIIKLEEYDFKRQLERSKTTINKFSIDNGIIDFEAKGEVEGDLLNQFALDEFDGKLRVATTVNVWTNQRVQYSNVYNLDEDLNVIGKLEEIAPDERIYSSRFMGDKLYLVTFKQIDPFFVIDLSKDQPEILGELKIPGYSSYLHPVSDDLIISIGRETGENEYDRVINLGVKVSLFDVSEFDNPKEVSKHIIGLEGSDSPALYDHRAFMYSESRNRLVVPIYEVKARDQVDTYRWSNSIWNGAYVYELNEDLNALDEVGTITHSESKTNYFDWNNPSRVKRSLYIGDKLYTISDNYVKANSIDSLNEIATIKIQTPKTVEPYYGEDFVESAIEPRIMAVESEVAK